MTARPLVEPLHLLRGVLVAGGVSSVGLVIVLLTYSRAIDGPYEELRASVLFAAAALAIALLWGIIRKIPTLALAILAAISVSPTVLVHAARAANRGASVVVRLDGASSYGATFDVALQGASRLELDDGQLVLKAPSGSTGFLTVRRPVVPMHRINLPRVLTLPDAISAREEVTLTAAVSRENAYFILIETERVLVQLTSWGVHLTAPDGRGTPTGTSRSAPMQNGESYSWQLSRAPGRATLMRDGVELWSGPDPGQLGTIRLGETRTDIEHGGTLRIRAFAYSKLVG